MSTYTIRPATAADLPAMVALRAEAERWLRKAGIRQWTADYDQYARGVLAASVEAGKAWVVEDDSTVIGTVTINGPDRDFWDPEDDLGSGLYLGKMIVTRSHAGRQVGDAILNWASRRAAAAGKKWVRLDTRRDNTGLHRYYLARGFEHVRTVFPPRRRTESGALFQRPAGSVTPVGGIVVQTKDDEERTAATALTKRHAREVVDIYLQAWQTQDPDLIVTIFTDDATYHERVLQAPIPDRDAIRAYWQTKVVGAQANIRCRLLNLYLDGNTAIVEWQAEFDDVAQGVRKRMREIAVLDFRDGLISALREYWSSEAVGNLAGNPHTT